MTEFVVIIPARYGSERLPGKPLRLIAGRPMIAHVQDRAMESGARRVIVATDDERIAATSRDAGGEAVMTRSDHATGTDRIAEVVAALGLAADDIVVNLQGDEPLMPAGLLSALAADLGAHPDSDMATVSTPMPASEVENPNAVKVVCDTQGYALYFSRAPVPWARSGFEDAGGVAAWHRHLGIYAYRAGFLERFPGLAVPEPERLERLEQLRALCHGFRIHVIGVDDSPEPGVDTMADLERVEARLRRG